MTAWQPIETAKSDGKPKVLYFPPLENSRGEILLTDYYKVDTSPDPIPRKATLWFPFEPPEGT